jgi:hypothetical protein
MHSRVALAWATLLLSAGGASGAALPPQRLIPFSQAPEPVQRGLTRLLGTCGEPAAIVRRVSRFTRGPVGGPGSRSYMFSLSHAEWPSPPGPKFLAFDGICGAPMASWSAIWMGAGGNRYKEYVMPEAQIYFKGSDFVIRRPDPNCDIIKLKVSWHACQHYLRWDKRAESFRPVTPDILHPDAEAWAPAHGYRVYY